MTDFPIKYRLIKKEKHTGARLGEIITPHGTFPTSQLLLVTLFFSFHKKKRIMYWQATIVILQWMSMFQ